MRMGANIKTTTKEQILRYVYICQIVLGEGGGLINGCRLFNIRLRRIHVAITYRGDCKGGKYLIFNPRMGGGVSQWYMSLRYGF